MARARGLGRGLSSLIPSETGTGVVGESMTHEVDVDAIDPNPHQPRRVFRTGELEELASSIRVHGVLQPLIVRQRGERYELIVGERRLRASRLAGRSTVPVIVQNWDDRTVMEVALVENLQRQDLDPVEEAEAFARLVEEFHWTQEDLAGRVGKSRPHVANMLRLLQLEAGIRDMLSAGSITVAHAKVLLGITGYRRKELAERCAREGWTVRQLVAAAEPRPTAEPKPSPDAHVKAAERRLQRQLGAKVVIRGSAERGRIEVPYRSLEELERLLTILERPESGDGGGKFVV